MKGFAIFFLTLSVLTIVAGFLTMSDGGVEIAAGAAMVGSGFTGILLSCAVIALADIRGLIREAVTTLTETTSTDPVVKPKRNIWVTTSK